METRKKRLKQSMLFMGFGAIVLLVILFIKNGGKFTFYAFSEDNVNLLIWAGFIWVSIWFQYYKYKKLERQEALKISGKIIKAQVIKLYSKYVQKQGTKYYLSAKSNEYPERTFTEEFSSKEYDFFLKHLKEGSEFEMLIDFENPWLFLIDFELIQRDYQGKTELTIDEQFGWKENAFWVMWWYWGKFHWKIWGILLITFWVFTILPTLGLFWGDWSTEDILTLWGIGALLIILGIYIIKKSNKDKTSPQDPNYNQPMDMFSSKPPRWFDWFPS